MREDFCGTALLCAAWCRLSPLNTALGVDLDDAELRYAAERVLPGLEGRVRLLHASVLDAPTSMRFFAEPPAEAAGDEVEGLEAAPQGDWRVAPADLVAAFNCSVCMLHTRAEVESYFVRARALCARPGIFAVDLSGGHSMECSPLTQTTRYHGFDYTFEQEQFDPVTRMIRCHISFKTRPAGVVFRRAFTYNWRLWTLPDMVELMRAAGFARVRIWLRRMRKDGERDSDEDTDEEEEEGEATHSEGKSSDEYVEVNAAMSAEDRARFAKGWQAYVVGVNE